MKLNLLSILMRHPIVFKPILTKNHITADLAGVWPSGKIGTTTKIRPSGRNLLDRLVRSKDTTPFLAATILFFLSVSITPARDALDSFIARGTVSSEGYREPSGTNIAAISKTAGDFLFSYSNKTWQLQFTFTSNPNIGSGITTDVTGTMIDYRLIPGGIREIINYSQKALSAQISLGNLHPSAIVKTNTFPEWEHQVLFLPWLSLCPEPVLPFVDSNHMRAHFESALLDEPKNVGTFQLNYIEPQQKFVSNLVVTNNGILFLVDGSTMPLPGPYKNGFPQFSYDVTETTNCDGIAFPLSATLCQYLPLSAGTSSKDIYPAVVTELHIEQIAVHNGGLALSPVPANLVALDTRPTGLNNGITVNYGVVNDQWVSATNSRIDRIANMTRHNPLNQIGQREMHARNRLVVFFIFAAITLVPLFIFIQKNLQTKNNKLKGST